MFYEPGKSDGKAEGMRFNPFKSLVVPRPIGWVSTLDGDGGVNLAPFSFFNAVSATPPMVLLAVNGSHSEGGLKDTVANIKASGEFVVNMATWELREAVNLTAAAVGRSTDEMRLAGLTAAPSRVVRPPRVAQSPVNLECVLIEAVELPGDPGITNHACFGRVVGVHISDDVIHDGKVDVTRLRPIARLGYYEYTVVDEVFEMRIPAAETVLGRTG